MPPNDSREIPVPILPLPPPAGENELFRVKMHPRLALMLLAAIAGATYKFVTDSYADRAKTSADFARLNQQLDNRIREVDRDLARFERQIQELQAETRRNHSKFNGD